MIRQLLQAGIGLAIAATGLTAAAHPAQAITCDSAEVGWYYNIRSISPTLVSESGSRQVTLKLMTERWSDWSHARLGGQTVPGDKAWVEWKDNKDDPWIRCPKQAVTGYGQEIWTTEAYNINAYMRACLEYSVYGYWSTMCTDSYEDLD